MFEEGKEKTFLAIAEGVAFSSSEKAILGSGYMMNSSSPAHSSISTTAIVGGGGGVGGGGNGSNAALSADDFHFPIDPLIQDRKDEAMLG